MARLRISIVGLGMAVEPHARSLVDLQDKVEVRWAASRSQNRIEQFASRYPFPVTTDVAHAVEDPEVDAVLLLTPPSTHLELSERCLNSGKHLLLEKPLELDVQRAARIVETADRAQRALGVVLQHRFRKSTRRAAAIIEGGELGHIQAATASVPWWRPQSYYDEPGRGTLARDGGGVLMTQAIHTIDVFRSLVGVSAVVSALATTTAVHRMECEDFVTALVALENGAPGSIMATTAAYPGRPEQVDVIGTLGTLRIKGDSLSFERLDGKSEVEDFAPAGTGSGADPMKFSHEAHRDLISDFVDAVRTGRSPRVSGRDALATQVLIDAILTTSRDRRKRPLPAIRAS